MENKYLEKIAAEYEEKGYYGHRGNSEIEGKDMNEHLRTLAKDKRLKVSLTGKALFTGQDIVADSTKKDFDKQLEELRKIHNAHRTMTGGKSNWSPTVQWSVGAKKRDKFFQPEKGAVDKIGRPITSKDKIREYIETINK